MTICTSVIDSSSLFGLVMWRKMNEHGKELSCLEGTTKVRIMPHSLVRVKGEILLSRGKRCSTLDV